MTFRIPQGMRLLVWAVALLLDGETGTAQGAGIGLETRVDRRTIRLGDPALLTVSIALPEGMSLDVSRTWPDSIRRFEWLTPVRAETTAVRGGVRVSFSRGFTSFDSGRWTLPSLAFVIDGKSFGSDTVGIEVYTVPLEGDEYRDIGDIIEAEEAPDRSPWFLFFAFALSALVGLAVWLYLRRRVDSRTRPSGPSPASAFEKAMGDLDLLMEEGLAGRGSTKAFHASLYDVLRCYLKDSRGWRVSSLTTAELIDLLSPHCPDREAVSRMAACLRMSDTVRFASHHPSPEDTLRCVSDIRSFISQFHENTPVR